jgi:hypothetical protein
MDSQPSFQEGTLIAKSTKSKKRKHHAIIKIGPRELTAEIPANYFDGENVNSLTDEWAVNTYDIYRYFQRKVRDTRYHVPVFAHGFTQATTVNVTQYRNYVQKKFDGKSTFARSLKLAYEKLVVTSCCNDISMSGKQCPKSLEDVNTIFLAEDHRELAMRDLTELCRRKYTWYEQHKIPGKNGWIKDTAEKVFQENDMKVTVGNMGESLKGKRVHCIVGLGKQYAYNASAGNLRSREKTMLGVTLEVRQSITEEMEKDTENWRFVNLPKALVDGSRRKEGCRFAVRIHGDVGFDSPAPVMPSLEFKAAMLLACDLGQANNMSRSDMLKYVNECTYHNKCNFLRCV